MLFPRKESKNSASGRTRLQSMVLNGVAARLVVALTLAGLLWLGIVWAVAPISLS